MSDRLLEKLLLNRNDPSIHISLAQVATEGDVIGKLRDHTNSSPEIPYGYLNGFRSAMSSRNAPYLLFHESQFQ
jgi:hypothetical protein